MSFDDDFQMYDRDGERMTLAQWSELHRDPAYQRIAQDEVGLYWVSTVWLGIDHGFGLGGVPLIFETMVFPLNDNAPELGELDCRRYATEAAAREGHEATVLLVRALMTLDEREEAQSE